MKYVLEPSLKHIALIKVATLLWNGKDIRSSLIKIVSLTKVADRSDVYYKLQDEVARRIQKLAIPQVLREKLVGFVRPIGLEIFKWILYHCIKPYVRVYLPAEFCWTSQGIIDRRKTAEILIKDEGLDITVRYTLACIYCLENDIPELWKKMPENFSPCSQTGIVRLWTEMMLQDDSTSGIENRLGRNYKSPYFRASPYCIKTTVEFFGKKLNPPRRGRYLVTNAKFIAEKHGKKFYNIAYIPEQDYPDIMRFLLSQMSTDQEREVLESNLLQVLYLFLEWPCQSFFLQLISQNWDLLDQSNFFPILDRILSKGRISCKDFDYRNLFREFWKNMPSENKEPFLKPNGPGFALVANLLEDGDEQSARLVFQDLTFEAKEKNVFIRSVRFYQNPLFPRKDLRLLSFAVHEYLLAGGDVNTIKDRFVDEFKSLTRHFCSEEKFARLTNESSLKRFFRLLDGFCK